MIVVWQCENCKTYFEDQKEKNRIDLVDDNGIKVGRQLWLCKKCTQDLYKHEMKHIMSKIPKSTKDAYAAMGVDPDGIFNFLKDHTENVLDV